MLPKERLHGSMASPKKFMVLERFPERGAVIPESKKLRHLLFGKKPSTYRIIYAVDKRNDVLNILHIRHSARAALSTKKKDSCSSS